MTLRDARGVIAAMFFFALAGKDAPTLSVPFLRLIEPAGGRHGLLTALRAMTALAREQGCVEVLLLADKTSPAWAEIALGLQAIGRTCGFVRRGEDWSCSPEARVLVLRQHRLLQQRQVEGAL